MQYLNHKQHIFQYESLENYKSNLLTQKKIIHQINILEGNSNEIITKYYPNNPTIISLFRIN